MYQEKIINIQTGEITMRDFTEEEIAEAKKNELEHKKLLEEIQKKEELRRTAFNKLIALGLTAEEAAAIAG